MTWAVIGLILCATIKLKILMKQSTIKELSDENEYVKNYAHQELSKKKIYPIFIHSTYFQAQTSLPLLQSTKKLTFAGFLPFFFSRWYYFKSSYNPSSGNYLYSCYTVIIVVEAVIWLFCFCIMYAIFHHFIIKTAYWTATLLYLQGIT